MALRLNRRGFLSHRGHGRRASWPRLVAQSKPVKIGLPREDGRWPSGGIQMEQGTIRVLKDRNYLWRAQVELLVGEPAAIPPAPRPDPGAGGARRRRHDLCPLAAFELHGHLDYAGRRRRCRSQPGAAEDMTQRKPNPYFVRASATSSQKCTRWPTSGEGK